MDRRLQGVGGFALVFAFIAGASELTVSDILATAFGIGGIIVIAKLYNASHIR